MIFDRVIYGGPALGIPSHLSFGQYMIDALRDGADEIALINAETGEQITQRELLQRVANFSASLKDLGLRKGDVVTVCSENRIETVVTVLASICCGAVVSTANLQYTEYELNHVLSLTKPRFIFCSETALKKHFKQLKTFSFIEKIVQYGDSPVESDVLLFSKMFIKVVDMRGFSAVDVKGQDDLAFILFSSGTTGLPKGVMLTHVNILFFAANGDKDIRGLSRYLTVVPWYHAYGMLTTICYIARNKIMVFLTTFNPPLYLNAIQKYKIQVLMTAPPIIVFLNNSPLVDKYDVSSVNIIWCGAAPLTKETADKCLQRFPNCRNVLQAYGMTETTLPVSIDSEQFSPKLGSGGRPLAGVQIKVVDIESRQRLDKYEKGEICVKGPNVMKGYLNNSEATREMFDEEGFLKTGDIGYYDEDETFFIVDRLKELIKYKGHQVSPAEVESVLLQHEGVADCGVVGKPHHQAGELTVAFVVRKLGQHVNGQILQDFVASKLSPAKHLHGGVIFVDEIPKNPSGKVLRRELRLRLEKMQNSKL